MIRVLTFDGDTARHKHYYTMIDNALRSRGSMVVDPQHRVSKEDRRSEARIREQLQAIGMPTDAGPEPDDPLLDLRPRTLSSEGGQVRLEQKADFALLVKYVEETQWQEAFSGLSVALEGWLDAADKEESGEGSALSFVKKKLA